MAKKSQKVSVNSSIKEVSTDLSLDSSIDIPKLPKQSTQKPIKPVKPKSVKPAKTSFSTTKPSLPTSKNTSKRNVTKSVKPKTSTSTSEERKARNRQKYRERIDNMTPEELAELRAKQRRQREERKKKKQMQDAITNAQFDTTTGDVPVPQIPEGFTPTETGIDDIGNYDDLPTVSPVEMVRQQLEQMTNVCNNTRSRISDMERKAYPLFDEFDEWKNYLLELFDSQVEYLGYVEYGEYLLENMASIAEHIYIMEYFPSKEETVRTSFTELCMILNGGALSMIELQQLEKQFNIIV